LLANFPAQQNGPVRLMLATCHWSKLVSGAVQADTGIIDKDVDRCVFARNFFSLVW
jgi:hypothetical protein